MSFPGTSSVYVPCDSLCMLFKCMCNNILIEKKNKGLFVSFNQNFLYNEQYLQCV